MGPTTDLWASANVKTKLSASRKLLETDGRRNDERPEPAATDWRERLKELTGINLVACPICGSQRLRRKTMPAQRYTTASRPKEPP